MRFERLTASLGAAFHDVPHAFQDLLDRHEAMGCWKRQTISHHHPIILAHHITGKPTIYVNECFTVAVDDLPLPEGRAILNMLYGTVGFPRFQMRHRWRVGDVVLWDNYATQHLACGDHYPAHRVVHRVTATRDRATMSNHDLPAV